MVEFHSRRSASNGASQFSFFVVLAYVLLGYIFGEIQDIRDRYKRYKIITFILATGIERRFEMICDLLQWIFFISGGLILKPQPSHKQGSACQENPTEVRPRMSSLRSSLPGWLTVKSEYNPISRECTFRVKRFFFD